jgi:hypothetical protein
MSIDVRPAAVFDDVRAVIGPKSPGGVIIGPTRWRRVVDTGAGFSTTVHDSTTEATVVSRSSLVVRRLAS